LLGLFSILNYGQVHVGYENFDPLDIINKLFFAGNFYPRKTINHIVFFLLACELYSANVDHSIVTSVSGIATFLPFLCDTAIDLTNIFSFER
jgi:hypothetical protein